MAFLYSILPEYTRNSDILTDNNIKGKVKALEEFMDTIDEEIFDIVSDSVKEILSFGSIDRINDEYLPYISYLLGYKWNYNLDSGIQRNLLNNILELYKRKGTKFSFNFSLYNLDPSITLYEPYNDIFILNKSGFDEFDYDTYSNFIWKVPVDAATTENIVLSGLQTIDNVMVKVDDRVLVKDQDNPAENGVYIVKETDWVRSEDSSTESQLLYSLYFVKDGLINRNKGWVCVQVNVEPWTYNIENWSKKQKITIDHNKIDSDLINFPVKVIVPSDNPIFNIAKSDGTDVRFVAAGGETPLKFEREVYDATQKIAVYHVKIPFVSSTSDTDFYMYYGNPNASDASSPNDVWDSNYKLVMHMGPDLKDSTSNNNNGTNYETVLGLASDGYYRSFDGSSYITTNSINLIDAITVSVFGKYNNIDDRVIVAKRDDSYFSWELSFSQGDPSTELFRINDLINQAHNPNYTIVKDTSYLITGTYDRSNIKIYKNDSCTDTKAYAKAINQNNVLVSIGRRLHSFPSYVDGIISEVRISSTARSDAWIKATNASLCNELLTFKDQIDLNSSIIFNVLKFKKERKYHLPSKEYYSWGIVILKINNLNPGIYELLSMIRPSGWKILIELRHGLYYNFNLKADNIVRNNYIDSYGLSILDFGEDENYYNTFINSIHYSTIKTFISIVFMGQIFDLKGNYFGSTVNNNITLEHIEHYNLYYETENNNYTLLRYSSHYTGYTHLYVVFMGSTQCYDLYLNSYSTIYEGIPI